MTDRFRFHSLTLPSTPGATAAASAWLQELGSRHGLSDERLFQLDLCASELLANIADHSYQGAVGEVRLELLLDQDTATLTVVDSGPPFDPLSHSEPPVPTALETAPIGGLGLHLVRQFADAVDYERVAGHNRLTVQFGSRPPTVQPDGQNVVEASAPSSPGDSVRVELDQRSEADRRLIGIVAQSALFHDVPTGAMDDILAHCELRTCSAGEVLLRAGEHHRCVLVTIEARLEVHLDHPDSQFFVELGPGECVGELSVADGKPNSAWVVAATPGRLLVIPAPVFLDRVLALPAVARNLIVVLSERMRRSNLQMIARLRAALELETLQRELDLARQIQASMLPTAPLFPAEAGIEGRGFMRAARQVGGDFYDAFPLGDGSVFIAIGDVCNKGTPAALFMVRTLSLLRSEALRPDKNAGRHLARLAARCNDLLCESNEAQQFVTLFCAIIDLARGRVHFVNAGHNPPLIQFPGAAPMFIQGSRNPIAGLIPGLQYAVNSLEFPVGSLLLLYTDGVTEAEAGEGDFFGDDALLRLLDGESTANADACVEAIVAAVDTFAAGHPQSDDITLLAVRRR